MGNTLKVAAGLLLALPAVAAAQDDRERRPVIPEVEYEPDPAAARVPFGVGEYLEYEVNASIVGGGSGFMAVEAVEDVRGEPTYRLNWYIEGSILFGAAKINQHNYSWLDSRNLTSLRYVREDVGKENGIKTYEIYPEQYYWEARRGDATEDGDLASALPLDQVSFIYYLRTMPLEVGETYSLSRYFKEEGNPVRIEVLRRDRIETDAGTFNTIVVRPTIAGESLFDEGARAELHFSDDEKRHLVYMKSETGILGVALTLKLKNIVSEGQPLFVQAEDGQQ